MARRKRHSNSDSLDMLLDTITNTFGGIVFIAILVVLIMGQSKLPETPEPPDPDQFKKQLAMNELKQKKQELEDRVAQQVAQLDGLQSAESLSLAKRWIQASNTLLGLNDALSDQMKKLRTFHSQQKVAERTQANLNQKNKVAQQQIEQLEQQLETEQEKNTVTVNLPRERTTRKRQSVVVLTGARMFLVDANYGKPPFSLNTAHFESCSTADALLILNNKGNKTRTSAGIDMADVKAVNDSLGNYDASRVFVTLAIFPDSFDQFKSVRDSCRQHKLEYHLLPMDKDGKISNSASGSRPKVQ